MRWLRPATRKPAAAPGLVRSGAKPGSTRSRPAPELLFALPVADLVRTVRLYGANRVGRVRTLIDPRLLPKCCIDATNAAS